jgi:nucleoside-diphosphate-sugar epimerase
MTTDIKNMHADQPRIPVLGATGGTGRLIVSQAVARGYEVAALVLSPEKGRDLKGIKLVFGDARDENALREARAGRCHQRAGNARQPVPRHHPSFRADGRACWTTANPLPVRPAAPGRSESSPYS